MVRKQSWLHHQVVWREPMVQCHQHAEQQTLMVVRCIDQKIGKQGSQ
jgi:hypothetical protein